MSTVREQITGQTIANEIMLERSAEPKPFLLVEGISDKKLFSKFKSHAVSIKECSGFQNLVEALTYLTGRGVESVLGILDNDYFSEIGYPEYCGVLIFTDEIDAEMMLLKSDAYFRVVSEVCSNSNVADESVRKRAIEHASKFSALRLHAAKIRSGYGFSGEKKRFIKGGGGAIDMERHFSTYCQRTGENIDSLRGSADSISSELGTQISKGHDSMHVLARTLRLEFGAKVLSSACEAEVIEMLFRLAFDADMLKQTRLYSAIKRWEDCTGEAIFSA